jgi:hypothetical protein
MSDDVAREIDDLQQFVQSPGYARFKTFFEDAWGDSACIARIDRALTELKPGDQDAEDLTVLQIRAAAREIRKLVHWPEQRIDQLKGAKPKSMNPMDLLRRRPR